jgi:hypothetical protein
MRVFKFNLATLLLAQTAVPRDYICFTIQKMAEPTCDNPDDTEYPRGMVVINKFRQLLPDCFKPESEENPYEIITSHVTSEFARANNGNIRMALVELAFKRHGSIELEFEIDPMY